MSKNSISVTVPTKIAFLKEGLHEFPKGPAFHQLIADKLVEIGSNGTTIPRIDFQITHSEIEKEIHVEGPAEQHASFSATTTSPHATPEIISTLVRRAFTESCGSKRINPGTALGRSDLAVYSPSMGELIIK